MGFRFSIEHANWLAHVLQPSGATPNLENDFEKSETLKVFVDNFSKNFYSSPGGKYKVDRLIDMLDKSYLKGNAVSARKLRAIGDYFRFVPWVALIIPSGLDPESDDFLTSSMLIEKLVKIRPEDPGLILQLKETSESISLESVFPAFKVAFAELTRWPGVLIWHSQNDAAFFEITTNIQESELRLDWLFRQLAELKGIANLGALKSDFNRQFSSFSSMSLKADGSLRKTRPPVRILHLSDLHLGSKRAIMKMPRVQVLIEKLVDELGEVGPIVPIITGDLMDTPSDENLAHVRTFVKFLNSLGTEEPILILGNHDVRSDGWLGADLKQAIKIQTGSVVKLTDHSIAFLCFNSALGDFLARGRIDDTELEEIGNKLDSDKDLEGYTLIAAVHHHPTPVRRPVWYKQSWYERMLMIAFDKTEELVNAPNFLRWLEIRKVAAVLHGHKHIPRYEKHKGMAIVGCGSTMGKVETIEDGQTYMSFNVITIDTDLRRIAFRFRAERIPGGGMEAIESHEISIRSGIDD